MLILPPNFMKVPCGRVPTSALLAQNPGESKPDASCDFRTSSEDRTVLARLEETDVPFFPRRLELMDEAKGPLSYEADPRNADGVGTDSRRSDRPTERCHNTGDVKIGLVDAGSVVRAGRFGHEPETREPMRILLVEDDLDLAQFIRKGLKEEQYAVDFAADGEEGLELALGNPYDLLILDIMLPKLDGLTLCRRLRAAGNKAPVLLLTARNTVEDKVSGFDTGADQFLTKPFAFAELLARVRALLRRGGPQQLVHLKAADLELDPASHRVWRAGKEIVLTNKEYALLEFLLRNKNRVLTRTAIIEHVWDISYDPMTNIVDAHIRALRAKMDRDFSPPLIATVRGAGYMLEEPEPIA
jgi:DNA-binding response OmpR family regulator